MSHAISPPRFRQDELNRRLCPLDEGDAFQRFVAELFETEYPGIHVFPGRGKDGCIDLVWPPDSTSTVFECKTVEEDGLDGALRIWHEVARKLADHLAAPDGPTSGQAQFRPWYRTDPPIREYVFCLSSLLANERQRQNLRDEIQGFFEGLAAKHAHLRHLGALRVLVRDWEDLSARLAARPHLLFRWFPSAQPRGLVVLGEEAAGSRFSEYLTSARLPYYARREHLARHPAPAGREIPDEEGLLASFEATGARGLVITGGGGFGKTRLMYELGRLAQVSGWAVFRVQGSLRADALEILAERLRPETPALVLVDYIEIQPAYGDWVETLEILADQRKLPLRYVACCRSSFYPSIQLIGRHQRVDLFPQTLDPAADRWLESFRKSTVRHIAGSTGLPSPEHVVAISRATPVLAVFAVWLHEQGRKGDLDGLLAELDFGAWAHKRVQQSFRDASVSRDLARFVALFPLPDGALVLLNGTQVRLLDTLAQDGWIEKVENEGAARWEVVHDVLADQVMVSYVATIPASAVQFVRELFEEAARVGCVESALTALQRIVTHAVVAGLPWGKLIGTAMESQRDAWKPAHLLVRPHMSVWLAENATSLDAQFILTAWLNADEEKELVRPYVAAWLEKHFGIPSAGLVMRAWLKAKGDFDLIREPAIRWFAEHRESQAGGHIARFLARQYNLPLETVIDILTWCRCFPWKPDSLWILTVLDLHLHRGEVAANLRSTCEVLAEEYLGQATPPLQVRALLAVLLAGLSRNAETRQAMRWLFLRWFRHPASLTNLPLGGAGFPERVRAAAENPSLAHFVVESFADGSLNNESDRETLQGLFAWVATWSEQKREGFRKILAEHAGHEATALVEPKEEGPPRRPPQGCPKEPK